jgi:hypothetical protein
MPQEPKEFEFNQVIKPEDLTEENIKGISSTVVRTLAEVAKQPQIGGGVFINLHIRIGKPPKKEPPGHGLE